MVTLNKPVSGDTNWYQPVTDNWTTIEKALTSGEGLTVVASTPSQITANQNNYAFAGGNSAYIFQRLSSDASRNITGISGGADGKRLIMANVGSFNIVLTNQDALSTAANRLLTGTGGSITLGADQWIQLVYDGTTSRWRVSTLGIDKSIVTAKGDLISASGASSPVRVGAGSDGQILTADSTQSSGLKWASSGSGVGGDQINYLRNSGFEINGKGTYGFPAVSIPSPFYPWIFETGGTPATGTIGRENGAGNFKSGLWSAKIDVTGGTGGGGNFVLFKQEVHMHPEEYRGKSITFSCQIKTSSASKAKLRITDSSGSTDSSFHSGGGSFENLTVTHSVGASATSLQVAVFVDTTSVVAVYVDEALLVFAATAGTYRPQSPGEQFSLNHGVFQGRLSLASATSLDLRPYSGRFVEINSELCDLDPTSITYSCSTSDNLINFQGNSTGSPPAANTLYYVYVSNAFASLLPYSMRLSTTAPQVLTGTGAVGVKYLGTFTNAINWRFVGWVKTNGSTQFVDSDTQRFVVNYYNRLKKRLFSCPGYSDNNAETTYGVNSTTFVEANGGTGSKVEFIANGEDAVTYSAYGVTKGTLGRNGLLGVGESSSSSAAVAAQNNQISASTYVPLSTGRSYVPSEGYQYLDLLLADSAAITFVADLARAGSAADPPCTFISAELNV
jgi:hypothetical protein